MSENIELMSREELQSEVKRLRSLSLSHVTPGGREAKSKKAKAGREMDYTKYAYRPVALKVAYLGYNYYGLAAQETDTIVTVESLLFQALERSKLVERRGLCGWTRCGRTDKGVSSFAQICSLFIRSNLPVGTPGTISYQALQDGQVGEDVCTETEGELPFIAILNRLLPKDIRIIAWSPIKPSFNARFDCKHRHYKYFFHGRGLDIEKMKEGAARFLGISHTFL